MTPSSAQCRVSADGETLVVSIDGRLDAGAPRGIRDELSHVGNEPARIILDLARLEWIDSTGVGLLLSIYRRSRRCGGVVKVAGLAQQPREVFRLLRLDSVLELFDSVEAAAASTVAG